MAYVVLNNAYSTLAASVASGDTAIVVQTGHGSRFAVGSDYTFATLEDASGNIEVVKVTAQSGDTLTVVRGQDGTAARAWNIGAVIECRPCKAAIDAIKSDAISTAVSTAVSTADVAGITHGATNKPTPVDADELPLADSAASWGLKKLTWANLTATVKAYFDTLYAMVGAITASGLTQSSGKLLGRTTTGTGQIEELSVIGPLTLSSGTLTTSMNTGKLLGRTTAGTGAVEEISVGSRLVLSNGVLDVSESAVGPATESIAGIVELATTAEAQALASAVVALTPARLADAFKGANQSLVGNGYQKLPGGLIMQWGSGNTGAGAAVAVTFPIAFPTATRAIGAFYQPSEFPAPNTVAYSNPTTTGMTIGSTVTTTGNPAPHLVFSWIAIGY